MDIDEGNNRCNQRDHGLSFETAQLVFDASLPLSREDPHPDGDRWQTMGLVLLFVVHTWPETDLESEKENRSHHLRPRRDGARKESL